MKEAISSLIAGMEVFTSRELLQKAAAYKGLSLVKNDSRSHSQPIKTYLLDDKLLRFIAERGIKREDRSDCNDSVFTLVDYNTQEKMIPGFSPSNFWNFRMALKGGPQKFDLRVSLSVCFELNIRSRGIILWPRAHSTYISAVDSLPNFRMFKALVEGDGDVPDVVREIVASDGNIVVTWSDLGLGGIRRMGDLFSEFVNGNETVMRLGGSGEIFNPVPDSRYREHRELFVTEPAQPKLFKIWRTQIEDYRNRLVVL